MPTGDGATGGRPRARAGRSWPALRRPRPDHDNDRGRRGHSRGGGASWSTPPAPWLCGGHGCRLRARSAEPGGQGEAFRAGRGTAPAREYPGPRAAPGRRRERRCGSTPSGRRRRLGPRDEGGRPLLCGRRQVRLRAAAQPPSELPPAAAAAVTARLSVRNAGSRGSGACGTLAASQLGGIWAASVRRGGVCSSHVQQLYSSTA